MYRAYEDPWKLQEQLEEEEQRQAQRVAEGGELDDFDYERIADLKERINFAWQDQEYDEDQARLSEFYGET
ncbi:MAG: hypothetical protein IKZ82_06040 [Clostridia bacterium]|nr:hypothetical protein [Clostridia bacterium]